MAEQETRAEHGLYVGAKVRCKRTGAIGVVRMIQQLRTADGVRLHDMVMIMTSETGGIVRDAPSVELVERADG